MPIFMDLHKVPGIEAKHAAEAHRMDIKNQEEFGCRCLTYWVDEKKESAFCLIDAPNKESVHAMHDATHGLIPHQIIQVNSNVVEAFLGRIRDPEGTTDISDPTLKVFNDPAFRVILLASTQDLGILKFKLGDSRAIQLHQLCLEYFRQSITKYEGREVETESKNLIASFVSVSQAMRAAYQIQKSMHIGGEMIYLKISVNAGLPVDGHSQLFGNTISTAEDISIVAKGGQVITTSIVRELYTEDVNYQFAPDQILQINQKDEELISSISSVIKTNFKDSNFDIPSFSKLVSTSKSGLYRVCNNIFAQSPNNILRVYRLQHSVRLLKEGLSISEAAFGSGFNSPSYFTKCFQEEYNLTPSEYLSFK